MADNVSRETRSKMMRSIRSVSRLEDRISKQLWRLGLRFRRNARTLPGKPDIAIKKYKIAIFIDSCFWHSCPEHRVMPKSNVEFWEKKFEANKRRDEKVNGYYLSNGWHLLRNWEHDFKTILMQLSGKFMILSSTAKRNPDNDALTVAFDKSYKMPSCRRLFDCIAF